MASYECTIEFGGVQTTAYADEDESTYSVENAVEDDSRRHYDRRPDDLERDMNIRVNCELKDPDEEPGEYDEEIERGIWRQR